jgi:choline dehydrogenase-like flavoprotein
VVHSVIYDARRGKASGVRVVDAQTGEVMEFNARIVFLCASALESARILLNSTSERWPNGLANSSGALGKYLMDHWMGWGAHGDVPGFEDKTTSGSRPNGTYVPRFRNVHNEQNTGFLRGYGFQGGGGRGGWGRGNSMPGFGRSLKEALRTPAPWTYSMSAWGECLPRETNFIALDPTVKDKWGVPALRITCAWDDNARTAMHDAMVQAAETLEAAGVRNVRQHQADNAMGLTIHEMGTARMGKDRATSVLNGWNQAWDVPNLFCTDGACMASSANQNPSITYMALTARATDHAVDLMKRREL